VAVAAARNSVIAHTGNNRVRVAAVRVTDAERQLVQERFDEINAWKNWPAHAASKPE
jgi:hypothetical protein